jgi:hypothetical protein
LGVGLSLVVACLLLLSRLVAAMVCDRCSRNESTASRSSSHSHGDLLSRCAFADHPDLSTIRHHPEGLKLGI